MIKLFMALLLIMALLGCLTPHSLSLNTVHNYVLIKAQFHTHTTASDGAFSPKETVRRYSEQGFDCIAITDHDTVAGWQAAIEAGSLYNVVIVKGEETTVSLKPWGAKRHATLLFINSRVYQGTLETVAYKVHSQGGIFIPAHSNSITWGSTPSPIDSMWSYYKNSGLCDAWEVANRDIIMQTSDINYLISLGKAVLASHDYHGTIDLKRYISWNILFAHNKTLEGVREAVNAKRLVVYYNSSPPQICGNPEALHLYAQTQEKTGSQIYIQPFNWVFTYPQNSIKLPDQILVDNVTWVLSEWNETNAIYWRSGS